jgi:hypothetical protein
MLMVTTTKGSERRFGDQLGPGSRFYICYLTAPGVH